MYKPIGFLVLLCGLLCLSSCGNVSTEPKMEDVEVVYETSTLSEINGNSLHVEVPEDILKDNGPLANEGVLQYKSDTGETEVTITGDEDGYGEVDAYVWSIQINSEAAGNEFEYKFSNMKDRSFVMAEDVSEVDTETAICIVSYENGEEVVLGEIGEASAHDANGTPIEAYYRIEGDSLIEGVKLTEDTVYPVTIE